MSSGSFLGVAKKVEQGVRDLEWLGALAAKLKEIGSVEQAESEVRGRYDKASKSLSELEGKVKAANKEVEVAEARKTRAEEVANKKLAEMQEMVNDTYVKAKKDSEERIGAAAAEVQTIKQGLEIERQSIQGALDRERLKLSRVQDDVEKATATLAELESKISAAKERAMKAYQETFRTEIS